MNRPIRVLSGVVCGLVISGNALADGGSSALTLSYQETGANAVNGSGTVSVLAAPSTYTYSDVFGTADNANLISGSPSPGYGFYDDFLISVPTASVDTIASTISLGNGLLDIENLQVRLYNTAGQNSLPVLGAPAGGAIDAWSSSVNYSQGASGTVSVLSPTNLAAGTYVLEVRGVVDGSAGGSYSGTINVQRCPVPLPASLPMMLGGLGLVVGVWRRKSGLQLAGIK